MKRILMTMGMMLASCAAMADVEVVDGITWTYTVNGDEASVGEGDYSSPAVPRSTTGAIVIPSMLGGHHVTSISDWAFSECEITSVTIPNGVTSVGNSAFWRCSWLASVAIPEGVTVIGMQAFYQCSGLTSVTIPECVTIIGESAFQGCSGLTSVAIPSSVMSIGDWAFNNCRGLTSVTISKGVTSIGSGAFFYCSGLKSVTIPEGVPSIGENAFAGCSGLKSVTVPSSVTSIGDYAFNNCSGLTNVVFGGNAPTCGSRAYFSSVASGCTATVYKGTTGWDDDGDGKWQGLTLVWRDAPKPDGGLYTETVGKTEWTFMVSGGKASVTQANPATGAVTIPSALGGRSVTSIGDVAFLQCEGLTSVTIPASVTTIGNSAFWGCSHLADVYFEGDTISSIEHEAFTDCYWDLIMHVPSTWKGRGRTICGYTVLKGSMFIVK